MNYYLMPAMKETFMQNHTFTTDEVRAFVYDVEERFGLKPGTLERRDSITKRPMKEFKGISLPVLRKAIIIHVYQQGYISVRDLGKALGSDHSSISEARSVGFRQLSYKDERLMQHLEKVEQLSIKSFLTLSNMMKKAG